MYAGAAVSLGPDSVENLPCRRPVIAYRVRAVWIFLLQVCCVHAASMVQSGCLQEVQSAEALAAALQAGTRVRHTGPGYASTRSFCVNCWQDRDACQASRHGEHGCLLYIDI